MSQEDEAKSSELVRITDADLNFEGAFEKETETLWATQEQMANLYGIDKTGISRHIASIFEDGEVDRESNMQKMHITGIQKPVSLYSLDVILSVGYRTNSKVAIRFRQFSNKILKAFITEGYALNETRLKEDPAALRQLASKVRELRSGEKQIYAAVRECFKISASDYDKDHDPTIEAGSFKMVEKWRVNGGCPLEYAGVPGSVS